MYSNLYIEMKADTPEVILDADQKTFSITGMSMPEDAPSFYRPIIQWLDKYIHQPFDSLCLDIKLLYCNTSSSKEIARAIATLGACEQHDKITVRWFYDRNDPETIESCRRFEQIPLRYEYHEYDFSFLEEPEEDPEGTYYSV